MSWFTFREYVSVAQRRANAAREIAKRLKKGATISPVVLAGRKITDTFWGSAWCENLESYRDFDNRLPRGRTYVRNGSVMHLEIRPGVIKSLVSGSSLYEVEIKITRLEQKTWTEIKKLCAGQIGSVVELLQGRLSQNVMDVVTRRPNGLFPKPGEIEMKCSCPDWAIMCKHVAAVLYGVGARLDHQPELLFQMRQVDHLELIDSACDVRRLGDSSRAPTVTDDKQLSEIFGIEFTSSDRQEFLPIVGLDQNRKRNHQAVQPAPKKKPAQKTPIRSTKKGKSSKKPTKASPKSRRKSVRV